MIFSLCVCKKDVSLSVILFFSFHFLILIFCNPHFGITNVPD